MIGKCLAALFACVLATFSSQAQAQSRTIKLIVPSTAGGGADVLSRMLSPRISEALG